MAVSAFLGEVKIGLSEFTLNLFGALEAVDLLESGCRFHIDEVVELVVKKE